MISWLNGNRIYEITINFLTITDPAIPFKNYSQFAILHPHSSLISHTPSYTKCRIRNRFSTAI